MKPAMIILFAVTLGLSSANAADLTVEYLQGEWCYEYMKAGDQVEQENKNWRFDKDGKFMEQTSDYNKQLKHRGNWDIKDGKLQIKPVFMGGHKPVDIVSDDKFIFKWMFGADMHVARGMCK